MIHRVYVAGPYTGPTRDHVLTNVRIAAEAAIAVMHAAIAVMHKGHDAHCPHTATDLIDILDGGRLGYERWMRLDLGLIDHWATALFLVAPSPGANREADRARERGLPVWTDLADVPEVTP